MYLIAIEKIVQSLASNRKVERRSNNVYIALAAVPASMHLIVTEKIVQPMASNRNVKRGSCAKISCWTLSAIARLRNQPPTVTKKMAIQRPIFGSGLQEAPHLGDTGGNEPQRENSQLLNVFGVFHFDSPVDFAFPNRPLLGEGGLS